ncbi:MAG TPA: diacylglycerol kinase family lipid kinase [Bacteroidales bacterium]|nr:diacylglycerol kinase family lipid kinase [Bacteroidales bacterium]HPB25038.1 diacylglycerol kinase family lipid kinase [Bacteroidales bacterium]
MTEQKKRIRFIINPKSGIGRQKKVEGLIARHLDLTRFDYEICHTEARAHAVTLSSEAAAMNYDAVIIVGGDGSINEAARGLIGTNTALGIIPAGSGNGLAHFLKISLNTRKAIEIINRYHVKPIDTGNINGHPYVSVAGLGFDAYVAKLFSKSRIRGFWAYAKIIFLQYLTYQPKRFKIYVDGKILKKSAFMLTFANSDQFGFNAHIAPTAVIDDGYIDLCIVRKPRIFYVVLVIPFLFLGLLHKTPFVKIIKTKNVKVIQSRNNVAHIDGDEIDLGRIIEVRIIPASLNIIC